MKVRYGFFIPFVALAIAAPPFASMLDLPLSNPGFEAWSENGVPNGWSMPASSDYAVVADCASAHEGKCAVRLQSKDDATTGYLALTQRIAPGPASGHRITLSGFIRTSSVQHGWAGLLLRVGAGDSLSLAFENMQQTGPRGTTPWQPFEVSVPVPPNASSIVLGVLLAGSGTAWFDD